MDTPIFDARAVGLRSRQMWDDLERELRRRITFLTEQEREALR